MAMLRIFAAITEWRRKRDERRWQEFERARSSAGARGMRMGMVIHVRQLARTGTKAYVQWLDDGGAQTAVWAQGRRLHPGQIIPVSGGYGPGPHHGETVLYVHQIGAPVASSTHRGWKRHRIRQSLARTVR